LLPATFACETRQDKTSRDTDWPARARPRSPPCPSLHQLHSLPTHSPDRTFPIALHVSALLQPATSSPYQLTTTTEIIRTVDTSTSAQTTNLCDRIEGRTQASKRASSYRSTATQQNRNTATAQQNSRNNRMIRPAPMAARSSTHAASSAYDSHASLAVSMEDFEAHEFSPTVPDLPSQHSIYRSGVASYQSSASSNRRSTSPPAWRKAGSGWFKHQGSLSPSRRGYHSREGSLEYRSADEDADREEGEGEITVYPLPSRIPLPESPTKGRSPSPSPVPYFGGGEATAPAVRAPAVNARPSTPSQHDANESEAPDQKTPTQMNCKFPVRRFLSSPPSIFPLPLSSICS
jgi:hypothetical protein